MAYCEGYVPRHNHRLAGSAGCNTVEISSRALTVIAEIQQKYATGNVLVRTLWSGPTKVISEPGAIDIVGHRVVHGGREYEQSTFVTDEVKAAIDRLSELAPAHNPANLEGIVAIERILGGVRQVAVFDTAFHTQMPEAAAVYPGPTNG
jgi:acetate kinase